MTSFVAVLPAIIPDLARRCVESMAPELRGQLLLVDNTETGEIHDEHVGNVMFSVKHGRNRGVTAPWNDALAMANALDCEWVYLVSQSVEFGAAGGLDLVEASADEKYICHSQYGWHALMINRNVWDVCGTFDPVFPQYGQEVDMLRRMHLAGLPSPTENGRELTQVNINASCEPDGRCLISSVVRIRYADHLEKLAAKWGGPKGAETFTRPYGRDELDYRFTGEPPEAT